MEHMIFLLRCLIDVVPYFLSTLAYTCHGHWQENQTTFIIAKHLSSQHGVCISYVPIEGNQVQVYVGDTCHRPGMQQHPQAGVNGNGAGAAAMMTAMGGGGGGGGGVSTTIHKTMANVTVIGEL